MQQQTLKSLQADLDRLRQQLHGMPERPGGSPWALQEYAHALQREQVMLEHAARSQSLVPEGLDFEGPAADRFRDNAEGAGREIGRLATDLGSVALQILQEASRLQNAISQWESDRSVLMHRIDDVKSAMRSHG